MRGIFYDCLGEKIIRKKCVNNSKVLKRMRYSWANSASLSIPYWNNFFIKSCFRSALWCDKLNISLLGIRILKGLIYYLKTTSGSMMCLKDSYLELWLFHLLSKANRILKIPNIYKIHLRIILCSISVVAG